MVEAQDLAAGVAILAVSIGLAGFVAAVQLPGSSSAPIPGTGGGGGSGGEPQKPRYDLTSSITISATSLGNVAVKGFSYETTKSGFFALSIASSDELAIGGANAVQVEKSLRNADGDLVASDVERIGELGAGQSTQSKFSTSNLDPGVYNIKYEVTFDPEVFTIKDNVEIVERQVEVPKQ